MENPLASWKPIITLLTDFGSHDYFVGAMKGVILSINPAAHLIDITHEIPPQDIHNAAFNLLAAYKDFPANTIHLAVVDPGVGSVRRPVLIECGNQFFVGPDNGIFSWVCQREGHYRAIHLTNEKFFRHPVSATFHGRDIFAPVAAALSTGVPAEAFGPAIDNLIHLESLAPAVISNGAIDGRIIHIDRFGNCITNLTGADFPEQPAGVSLIINGHEITSFRHYFSEGIHAPNEVFGVVGSAGFIEIAAVNTSAAAILGAQSGQAVKLMLTPNEQRRGN